MIHRPQLPVTTKRQKWSFARFLFRKLKAALLVLAIIFGLGCMKRTVESEAEFNQKLIAIRNKLMPGMTREEVESAIFGDPGSAHIHLRAFERDEWNVDSRSYLNSRQWTLNISFRDGCVSKIFIRDQEGGGTPPPNAPPDIVGGAAQTRTDR